MPPAALALLDAVGCLARSGRKREAVELCERTTRLCSNDLGLLAEQADPATGEPRGDFPQTFSHVGLINAAWCLSQSGTGRASGSREVRVPGLRAPLTPGCGASSACRCSASK